MPVAAHIFFIIIALMGQGIADKREQMVYVRKLINVLIHCRSHLSSPVQESLLSAPTCFLKHTWQTAAGLETPLTVLTGFF